MPCWKWLIKISIVLFGRLLNIWRDKNSLSVSCLVTLAIINPFNLFPEKLCLLSAEGALTYTSKRSQLTCWVLLLVLKKFADPVDCPSACYLAPFHFMQLFPNSFFGILLGDCFDPLSAGWLPLSSSLGSWRFSRIYMHMLGEGREKMNLL